MLLLFLEFILKLSTLVSGATDSTVELSPEQLMKMTIQHSIELTAEMVEDLYNVHVTMNDQSFRRSGEELQNISSLSTRRKRDIKNQSIKLKMENLMMNHNYGFFSAAMVGIIDTIVDKEGRDLKTLIDAFGRIILRKSYEGKLMILGNFFESRVKLLVYWTSLLPLQTIKSFASNVKLAIENGNMLSKEIDEIVSLYDTFFTADEGEHLLSAVAELYQYNSYLNEGTVAVHLMKNLVDAVLAPASYRNNSAKLRILISMLNKIYMKTLPEFWRSETDAMVETLTQYERNQVPKANYIAKIKVTTKEGHVIQTQYKHRKLGFKETLNHLFKKHPKFYEKLMELVTESKKQVRNDS